MFKMNSYKPKIGLRIGIVVTLFGSMMACAHSPKSETSQEAYWGQKRRRTRIASFENAPVWGGQSESGTRLRL